MPGGQNKKVGSSRMMQVNGLLLIRRMQLHWGLKNNTTSLKDVEPSPWETCKYG
jgi:hypothetical protein